MSAFTVAHSITLGLAALKIVSLPPAFIEPAIAVTIVLAALDNILADLPGAAHRRDLLLRPDPRLRLRGRALGAEPADRPISRWALLQFNVGLEVGQLLIVAVATTALFGLRALAAATGRVVLRGGSLVAIVFAALWLIERTANVSILPS